MSILAQCPACRNTQSVRNKVCKCGNSMDKSKKNGKVVYYIKYRLPGGKQKKEKVGTSYSEAVAADGKRASQKAEGKILDIRPGQKTTFSQLYEDWFKAIPQLDELKSKDVLLINLNSFLKEFGRHNIYSLTKHDIESYQIKRQKDGLSASYIDQEVGAARNMLNRAWSADKVSGDALKPFKQAKKLLKRHANARDFVLGFDDVMALISHMQPHARNITLAAFYTGMRAGEIVNLTWDRVDLSSDEIILEAEHTKTDEKRIIPICDELHKILEVIPKEIRRGQNGKMEQVPEVFLYKGLPVKSIRWSLKKACEKAGIPYGRNTKNGITFHDLRHTFNTNMRKAGIDQTIIMEITGHKTREMFDRYNTVDRDEKKDAVKKMARSVVPQSVPRKKKGGE